MDLRSAIQKICSGMARLRPSQDDTRVAGSGLGSEFKWLHPALGYVSPARLEALHAPAMANQNKQGLFYTEVENHLPIPLEREILGMR
jgi:hypothetical protein